jgi:hypothetical protein
MATTPLNVSASDSKSQTETQGASIEMQARLPGVDDDDKQIGTSDAAAGLTDAQVQPSVFVDGGSAASSTPSDAAAAEEKRMLDAIDGALEQGPPFLPRAVVDAMWIALPRCKAYNEKRDFEELPISAACAMDQSVAVISKLMQAFPDHVVKKNYNGMTAMHWAAWYNSNAAVFAELLKAYPEAARQKDEYGNFPLHWAAWYNSNVAVFAELLKAYPEAAGAKDKNGDVPLQRAVFAARNNSDAAVIAEFFKAFPAADTTSEESVIFCMKTFLHRDQFVNVPNRAMKSFLHPLRACIRFSADLMTCSRSQRSKDIRLANDADEKGAELEQLACAIARNCEDSSLFGQEMDDCLQLAANLKLKFFISEPACSRRIEELWYPNPADVVQALVLPLLWFSGLNFIFNLQGVTPPFVRFLMNRASYLAFLVCLLQLPVLAAPGDTVNNIGLEVFLAYWLFDICFSEAAEFLDIMKKHRLTAVKAVAKYVEDPWNVYDVVTLSAAVAAAVVRGVVYAGVGDATAAASNQLYAWALALLWGRLVNVLSAVSFVGPLLIMVLAMIFRDLSKFAFLVVLMELPFVAALYFLESGDGGNEAFATFPDSALSFFKIVIGQGPDVSSVTASSSVLLSVGSVLLSVLLLNLLIAMFSKTFDTIVENSTQEYLLQKAQLTFTWARAPRMPPPFACALALRDWAMTMVARHVWHNGYFRCCCAGWDTDDEPVEPPPPTFDKKHFYAIVFPKKIDSDTKQEHYRNPAKREEWNAQWMQECDAKYEAWCEKVLADLEENAEFNSEAQMDKFKSRMLRGMETTVESSGKIDQIAENAKATQEQMKATQEKVQALSDAVQSHATQEQVKALSDTVQQMHASMQLILQKLNP